MSNTSLGMADYPQWAWSGSRDPFFLILPPNYIFGVGETRQFKCRVLIDTEVD